MLNGFVIVVCTSCSLQSDKGKKAPNDDDNN